MFADHGGLRRATPSHIGLRPMYVSMSRLRVPAERAEELVTAFRARAKLVDAFEGFVDLQVWQADNDAGELVMVSRWRDRDCFKTYMKSQEHQVSHDRIDPALDAAIKLEKLEHMHVVAD
jgi:heme oxygenase (mycobilin-producing)